MASKKDLENQKRNERLIPFCRLGPNQIYANGIVAEAGRLLKRVYAITFEAWHPKAALISQLIRSLNSVGANISEGLGFGDGQNLVRFAKVARGSAYESVFHADCLDLEYRDDIMALASSVDSYLIEIIVANGVRLAEEEDEPSD